MKDGVRKRGISRLLCRFQQPFVSHLFSALCISPVPVAVGWGVEVELSSSFSQLCCLRILCIVGDKTPRGCPGGSTSWRSLARERLCNKSEVSARLMVSLNSCLWHMSKGGKSNCPRLPGPRVLCLFPLLWLAGLLLTCHAPHTGGREPVHFGLFFCGARGEVQQGHSDFRPNVVIN